MCKFKPSPDDELIATWYLFKIGIGTQLDLM